jgi:hypothetical protein
MATMTNTTRACETCNQPSGARKWCEPCLAARFTRLQAAPAPAPAPARKPCLIYRNHANPYRTGGRLCRCVHCREAGI